MRRASDASPAESKAELQVVGTSVTQETEALLDRLAASLGRRAPRVLQVGSRTLVADRNVRNWRNLVSKRFGSRARFIGLDLLDGANVDRVLDICGLWPPEGGPGRGGVRPRPVLPCAGAHPRSLAAARNIEGLLRPGGLVFVSAAWSQAFHATPDDLWRFSVRGLMRLFGRLEVVSAFYSGGDVGLDCLSRCARRQARARSAIRSRRAGPVPARAGPRGQPGRAGPPGHRAPPGVAHLHADPVRQHCRPPGLGSPPGLAVCASEQHGHVASRFSKPSANRVAAVWWKIEPLNTNALFSA